MVQLRLLLCAAACLSLPAANAQGYDHDWAIEPIGDIIVQAVEDDIIFRYIVPALREGKECSVRLYEVDCITDGGSSVYMDKVDTTSVELELAAHFRIDMDTVRSSGYYTGIDPYRGRISFCTRVDCTLNGASYNFHETKLMVDFDWTVGFAINAELGSTYSRYKLLDEYKLSMYITNGELGGGSLGVIKAAAGLFLEAEMNDKFKDNPVQLATSVMGQQRITKQVVKKVRHLQGAGNVTRRVVEYETLVGTELAIGLEALFDHEPAPRIEVVNAAQADAYVEKAHKFLVALTTVISLCDSELANITEVEMEYAKSLYSDDYENGQLIDASLVNSTLATGLADMTYDKLLFTQKGVSACRAISNDPNVTTSLAEEIGKISEMAVPERQEGGRTDFLASVSFGHPVDAFFCDASNNQVPVDPVLSQGDTVRVCVRQNRNSSYFHLEDIYTMALTQPTTGVMTHYAVYNGNFSAASATKNCQLGLCNVLTQVPSRFFDRAFGLDSGPIRIVGVALLNLGPGDSRRILAPIEFSGHRQLQTSDIPRSAFELEAKILALTLAQDLDSTNNTETKSNLGGAVIIPLAAIITVVALVIWFRRRKQEASRTPSEPLPTMQPVPSMKKVEEPMRNFSRNKQLYTEPCPFPINARSA